MLAALLVSGPVMFIDLDVLYAGVTVCREGMVRGITTVLRGASDLPYDVHMAL